MVGASKLNWDDVKQIRRLIAKGHNDYKIAREYVPQSGKQVSRVLIRDIRVGKRWNADKHSFVMKVDINDLPTLQTMVNGDIYETQLGWLVTRSTQKWFFLTLVNSTEVDGPEVSLMDKKPSKSQIMKFHNSFVELYL